VYGLSNITANNGWAMALVGATIVFLGLVVLSFVISQIHRILGLWDRREELLAGLRGKPRPAETPKIEGPVYKERRLPTVDELVSVYRPLVEQLKEPFDLMQLFEISNKMEIPHPNLSINRLREANILIAQGDGKFTWSN